MLLVISPAKSLDFSPITSKIMNLATMPDYLEYSQKLISILQKLSPQQIAELMSISDKLAVLNFQRFYDWQFPYPLNSAKPAVLAFAGDVYDGLMANNWKSTDFKFAQQHLVILSGLYGILRPLDCILPYRLEMSTALINPKGKDLYNFWGDKLRLAIEQQIVNLPKNVEPLLINLASQEYFKVLQPKKLSVEALEIVFEDEVKGKYKVVSFYAKRARGMFANFVVKHRLTNRQQLVDFAENGYHFYAQDSSSKCMIFRRKEINNKKN